MKFKCVLYILLVSVLLIIPLKYLSSQEKKAAGEFIPEVGLEGKDVAWIPTPQSLVDKMLELAEITPDDFLIDLGSGDGRLVITAAKLGTKAIGVEYNPDLVDLSKIIAEKEGVTNLVKFIEADIYEFDFTNASVIAMFLLPHINLRLRPKLLEMKPGTRIVSNTFTMQEWHYDGVAKIKNGSERWNTAYLWIVPAKVDGKWALSQGGELTLKQEFQMLSGSLTIGNKDLTIYEGRLRGNEITFIADGDIYNGLVTSNRIVGTITSGGGTKKWSATR